MHFFARSSGGAPSAILGAMLVLASGGAARAQDAFPAPAPPRMSPPAELVQRVSLLVAERWGVDAASVRLDWSAAQATRPLPARLDVQLGGSGAAGRWDAIVISRDGTGAMRIPVRAGVEIEQSVAAWDLERGITIAAEDIAVAKAVHWGQPKEAAAGVEPGWVTRRRIPRGEVLREPAVARAQAVKAGDHVRLLWTRGPIEVAFAGKAAGSAAVGGRVAVRTESGRRVEGIVRSAGVVQILSSAEVR